MASTKTNMICVREVMTPDPISVNPFDTVQEVARILDSNEISGVPVIDGRGQVVGVVSKTDLIHRCLEGPLGSRPGTFFEKMAGGLAGGTDLDPEELGIVEEFMSTDLVTAEPDESIAIVARRLAKSNVHRAVVVNAKQGVVGIVTALDLLGAFPD
ncbi:MAG: CBS domain-containing protein [Planctomycetota bacterium]